MAENGKRILFTTEEDMKMWRFAIEKNGTHAFNMWKEFRDRTDSIRSQEALHSRFRRILLHHLPQTLFHTETKLKLCIQNEIRVDAEFLKALVQDAEVKLDTEGIVTAYTMKPTVRPNTDMELDDEEFMKSTSPIVPHQIDYTEEEDAELWKFLIENHRKYRKGSEVFWKDLALQMENVRSPKSLSRRFNRIRDSQLQKIDMDMEVKLELYKKCEIPVDAEYLKMLEEHYDLEVDAKRRIISYEKIDEGEIRSSSDKKLEQRKLISVKTEDVVEPVAKRTRYEKDFYIDSESDLDVTDSESRFGDFEDVLPVDEPQGSTPKLRELETMNMAKRKNVDQKATISKNTEKKMMRRSRNSEESQSSSVPVTLENQLDANGSGVQLQELENRIVDKLTNVVDAKIAKMSENLEESLSMKIAEVSKEVKIIRRQISNGSAAENDQEKVPSKKEYLLKLKNLASSFNSPDLEDIQQKIDAAIDAVPEEDEEPVPTNLVRCSLDATLSMFSYR